MPEQSVSAIDRASVRRVEPTNAKPPDTVWRWHHHVRVHATWIIAFTLLTWTLAIYFRDQGTDLPQLCYWALGAGATLAFFTCVLLYEFGHVVMARANGLRPQRTILSLLGGITELKAAPATPGAELLISLGGPAIGAVLTALFWGVGTLGRNAGWSVDLVLLMNFLCWGNASLLALNLLPVIPLDGGRLLRSILWACLANRRRATRWAALFGYGLAGSLLALGAFVFFTGQRATGKWIGIAGLGLAVVGMFRQGADGEDEPSVSAPPQAAPLC